MLPRKLERDNDNNLASREFKVNQPVEMDLMDRIQLNEDLTFSQMYHGERLDLISLGRVVDHDGPDPLKVWGEVMYGNITLEQDPIDQSFNIVPEIDWSGTASIRFHATDGSVTKTDSVIVDVLEVPDPPRFETDIRNVTVFEDIPYQFDMVLEDVDSTDLSLNTTAEWITIEKKESGHRSVFQITVEATDQYIGAKQVMFNASDGETPNVELTLTINVNQTNDPPRVVYEPTMTARRGQDLVVDLNIEDPDGDLEFTVTVDWMGEVFISHSTSFTLVIPEDAELGDEIATVTVDDGNGENGVTQFTITVDIEKKKTEDYSRILLIMITIIFITLIIYGVFLRVQERRQKRLLGSVGTSAPLEARPLSEKDFNKAPGKRRRRRKDDGIPMPPAPLEVEGALVREEKVQKEDVEADSDVDLDLESDLDDILNEMFP